MRGGRFLRAFLWTAGVAVVVAFGATKLAEIIALDRRTSCISNLKDMGTSASIYVQDYDDRLPPAQWMTSLHRRLDRSWGMFHEPLFGRLEDYSVKSSVCGYAMNWQLVGHKMTSINPKTVLFFETDALAPDITASLGARSGRHQDGSIVEFADTSAKYTKLGAVLREEP